MRSYLFLYLKDRYFFEYIDEQMNDQVNQELAKVPGDSGIFKLPVMNAHKATLEGFFSKC